MQLDNSKLDKKKISIIIEEDDVDKSIYDFKKFYDSIESADVDFIIVDASTIEYVPTDFLSILVKIYDISKNKDAFPPIIRVKKDSLIMNLLKTAHFNNIYKIEGV